MSLSPRFASFALAVCLLTLAPGHPSSAQSGDKSTEIKATRSKQTPATKVDFAKELKISYPSLTTLGARIEQARTQGDPVGLAAVACELAAVETASGKTATLTSGELYKEAAQLAEERGISTELNAVAVLIRDSLVGSKLTELAKKAKAFEEARAIETKEGARSRGATGQVRFINQTNDDIVQCYVNGFPISPQIRPGQWVQVSVNDGPFNATFLRAIGSDGNRYEKTVGEGTHPFVQFVIGED